MNREKVITMFFRTMRALFLTSILSVAAFGQQSEILGTHGDIDFDTVAPHHNAGILLLPKATWPHVDIKLGASGGRLNVFDPSDVTLFSVRADGKVGVGMSTTTPQARLHVFSDVDALPSLYGQTNTIIEADVVQNDYGLRAIAYEDIAAGATNTGTVMGARVASYISGGGTAAGVFGVYIESGILGSSTTATVTNAYGISTTTRANSGTLGGSYGISINALDGTNGYGVMVNQVEGTNGYGLYVKDMAASNAYSFYSAGATDNVYVAGKVGIGTNTATEALHVVGNIKATGSVTSTYQDVAEWVPSAKDLAPGTVVIVDDKNLHHVAASSRPYDTSVAGVVSVQPGLILGVGDDTKEMIATTGRVKVRVSGPVAVGDLLVTSEKPGFAMRSEPMEINGRKFHQPGTLIGKALEPLEGGEGEILVLLSLQ